MKKIILILTIILSWSNTLYADDRFNPWIYNETKIPSEKKKK